MLHFFPLFAVHFQGLVSLKILGVPALTLGCSSCSGDDDDDDDDDEEDKLAFP